MDVYRKMDVEIMFEVTGDTSLRRVLYTFASFSEQADFVEIFRLW